uniref:Transmembrane protein n=1 Tax=Steinernema glaseri TaxID=37863 RepID=A0A1I8AM72_9BILA
MQAAAMMANRPQTVSNRQYEPTEEKSTHIVNPKIGFLLTIAIACFVAVAIYSYAAYEYTSKPCDTNAYLDKAHLLNLRQLSHFHNHLFWWLIGNTCSRHCASNMLKVVVAETEALQKELSQSEDEQYRTKMALSQVYLARAENESQVVVSTAIERYLNSLAMDRALVLQKFLVDFIGYAENDAVARVKVFLVPFELKISELKKMVPQEHHTHIDIYWTDLKRSTTPGILNSCLPGKVEAEEIVEVYKKMTNFRVAKCVPIGRNKKHYELTLIHCFVLAFIVWLFVLFPIYFHIYV